ncbi:hypothetical protein CIPAW_06G170600 [Carya illinoinensis]|uniref:Uncharacterized protein n=1 Tax=Carya illinoinensis TaxID=32201 RepID=A0A8T1QCT4_CARIL|nr:hypothetical protein CIPAW_06G170600 [Carya illinoinensis]KAG6652236.1 hypothetical protein CIPAW_06G170600 [Carya illinoinensis]KAG6652237.1 hypothetical protein CIPAW_06G170600 [Carya illinoinensis]KAG6652238.1 hypothetical protein CIPAW_06G170600 [Carya illinoinensis]KAG6652239.1 hypothetical protein CIPAW_06G170600 [Carya illinoinensis]
MKLGFIIKPRLRIADKRSCLLLNIQVGEGERQRRRRFGGAEVEEAQGEARQAEAMGRRPQHRPLEDRQVRPLLERIRFARSQLLLHSLPSIQRKILARGLAQCEICFERVLYFV